MTFNDIERQRIKLIVGRFCQEKIPDNLRSQIKVFYKVRGYDVKIIETRPDFMRNHEWTETQIARLKCDPDAFVWQLYWMRASGRWEKYAEIEPTNRLQLLVDEIAHDPHRMFWG